tara:strand:- start:1177 stop:1449 length:273 start_codon:yes stop_codon:yes gene_type:complete
MQILAGSTSFRQFGHYYLISFNSEKYYAYVVAEDGYLIIGDADEVFPGLIEHLREMQEEENQHRIGPIFAVKEISANKVIMAKSPEVVLV